MKEKLCVEDGRYCPVVPSEFDKLQKTNNDAKPTNLVKQSIREVCVYKALPESGKSHWFLYIDRLINECLNPEEDIVPITNKCNDQVISDLSTGTYRNSQLMDKLHIDMDIYNSCLLTEAKAIKAHNGSSMDKDLDLERSIGTIFHPSVSINNHTFRGDYNDPNELFKAMCSTMVDRPSIC